jgi:DNA repair exonuclease SbcCD nuclease subunit
LIQDGLVIEDRVKIVHAADLHIDSPLRGLERYEGAPAAQLRNATRRALENLVQLCLDEGAALLLIAGDVFDGDWRDYSTGLFFSGQLARLRMGGVRVVSIRGNHDAQSQISRELRLPENVRELHTRRPESVVFEDLGVAIHGQGFSTREVREDLAAGYPAPISGLVNIALLHTALNGRPEHATYAPSSIEVLRGRGYDYWALGHIHSREVVSTEPWVVFPGNLQGRHAREVGPKGATVITLEGGRIVDVRHETLDAVRWAVCQVDASAAGDAHDVVELVRASLSRHAADAGGRLLAARVVVKGETRAHVQLMSAPERWTEHLRACALDVGEGAVWLERALFETSSGQSTSHDDGRADVLAELAAGLRMLLQDPNAVRELSGSLEDLKHKLPPAASEGERGVRLDDPASLAPLLEEAGELLLARLLGPESA